MKATMNTENKATGMMMATAAMQFFMVEEYELARWWARKAADNSTDWTELADMLTKDGDRNMIKILLRSTAMGI